MSSTKILDILVKTDMPCGIHISQIVDNLVKQNANYMHVI
jgi:hypothetical protein